MTFNNYALSSSHPSPIRFCSSLSHSLHTRSWLFIIKLLYLEVTQQLNQIQTLKKQRKTSYEVSNPYKYLLIFLMNKGKVTALTFSHFISI